jgi:lipopolysaccharide transport system permease protein
MEITEDRWHGLERHADEMGLLFLSSPFSVEAVTRLYLDQKMSNAELAISQTLEAPREQHASAVLTVIRPRRGWQTIDLEELWKYRELLFFLTWRDVKVRYKQTALGAAWAILQPIMTMIVFTVFFRRLAGVSAGSLPYPIFAFAGLLPWTFFANAISGAGMSVVGSERLITKIYFPRLIIPISAVGAGLVDFVIASGMLGVMIAFYRVSPPSAVVLAPLLVGGLFISAVGMGSLLAALNVAYRDFRHVIPFMMQLWMFCTPTIYMQSDRVAHSYWRFLLPLNPAYGLISNFRSCVLGGELDHYTLAVSFTVGLVLFVAGTLYFRRVERGFADII